MPRRLPSITAAALAALRARTPARLVVGRAGQSYRTGTQLELREDHAAAVDAVHAELDLHKHFGREFVAKYGLFEVSTLARDKREYLRRPELGRALGADALALIGQQCPSGVDLQVVVGDGLSVAAVAEQVPPLLPLLLAGAERRGWSVGRPFAIRFARVGVLNDIGAALDPSSRRAVDRRASGPGHGGEPVGLSGVSSASRPHQRRPQSDFEHSCPRRDARGCRGAASWRWLRRCAFSRPAV